MTKESQIRMTAACLSLNTHAHTSQTPQHASIESIPCLADNHRNSGHTQSTPRSSSQIYTNTDTSLTLPGRHLSLKRLPTPANTLPLSNHSWTSSQNERALLNISTSLIRKYTCAAAVGCLNTHLHHYRPSSHSGVSIPFSFFEIMSALCKWHSCGLALRRIFLMGCSLCMVLYC